MTVTVVVGAQWGDEGKGRTVDYMAQTADLVIRFQGGDNAGHTVVNEHGEFRLHLVPSGIFSPQAICLIGAATNLIMIFLACELLSVASYVRIRSWAQLTALLTGRTL